MTNGRIAGTWSWRYDAVGRPTGSTAANGQGSRLEWNADDTLRQHVLSNTTLPAADTGPDSVAGPGVIAKHSYTYDTSYRVHEVRARHAESGGQHGR